LIVEHFAFLPLSFVGSPIDVGSLWSILPHVQAPIRLGLDPVRPFLTLLGRVQFFNPRAPLSQFQVDPGCLTMLALVSFGIFMVLPLFRGLLSPLPLPPPLYESPPVMLLFIVTSPSIVVCGFPCCIPCMLPNKSHTLCVPFLFSLGFLPPFDPPCFPHNPPVCFLIHCFCFSSFPHFCHQVGVFCWELSFGALLFPPNRVLHFFPPFHGFPFFNSLSVLWPLDLSEKFHPVHPSAVLFCPFFSPPPPFQKDRVKANLIW